MDPDSNDGVSPEPEDERPASADGEAAPADGPADDEDLGELDDDDLGPPDPDRARVEQAFLEYRRRKDLDPGLTVEAFAAAECPDLVERLRDTERERAEFLGSVDVEALDALFDELDPEQPPATPDAEGDPAAPSPVSVDISGASRAPRELLDLLAALAAHRAPTRYDLEGQIARGGMGRIELVWDESLRRLVARKVMLGDEELPDEVDASPVWSSSLARFLDEALVTGQLDHPGIVPVHELGVDDAGRVYFTMKLVNGHDLAKVIEFVHTGREGWTTNRAVGALRRVCEAVAYAHSKGVIHRDIKPANVMVGRYGETYLMDWGLASVAGAERAEFVDAADLKRHVPQPEEHPGPDARPDTWLFTTQDGKILGTPFYMSPEQARGDVENVDHRSDVYSLGAILYHLICGRMPYEEVLLEYGTTPGVVGLVLRAANLRPPRSLRALAPEAPPTLVEICERAMAREPKDRYPDADAMAEALGNYLEDISEAREEARRQARRAELINNFLVRMLSASDPDNARGRDVTVREVLDRAAAGIGGAFEDQSLDEAALRRTIGILYTKLGSYAEADMQLSRAYELLALEKGEDDIEALEVFCELSHPLRMHRGDERAIPLLREAVARMRVVLGSDHAVTLQGEYFLAWALRSSRDGAAESGEIFQALLDRRLAAETFDAAAVITLVNGLSQALKNTSRMAEAADVLERHRPRLAEHLDTSSEAFLKYDLTLMSALIGLGRLEQAEAFGRELDARASAVLPARHDTVINVRNGIGLALSKQGRHEEAEALYAALVEIAEDPEHRSHHDAACFHNRGLNLVEGGRPEAAVGELARAVEVATHKLEDGHPITARFRTTYGRCLRALGRDDEARAAWVQARDALAVHPDANRDWLSDVERELDGLDGEADAPRSEDEDPG